MIDTLIFEAYINMRSGTLMLLAAWCSIISVNAQTVKHAYRFYENFEIAQPECGPDISPSKALGNCNTGAAGSYVDDILACGVKRKVYHTTRNWGLSYPNATGVVTNTYTIQMYIKVTDWGDTWARIIDFSNGQLDEGIYFKNNAGQADRCIDFYPSGIAGPCPYFNTSTYYLLTFTRNGQTGIMDVYVGNTLFVSYNDADGKYVGKSGTPIYIFRDDAEISCESGEANFAYLSFSNQYSSVGDVSDVYNKICVTASINTAANFTVDPNPSCGFSKNINIKYTGEILGPGTGYSFDWDWDGGNVVSGSGLGPFAVTWDSPGSKNVTLTVTNTACGNKIANIQQVAISSLDLKTTVQTDPCTNDKSTITISAVDGTAPYEYSIDSVNYQTDPVFKVKPDFYRVYIKDSKNCVSRKNVNVDSVASIYVKTISDTTICEGQQVLLETSGNVTAFAWTPSLSLDNASSQSPVSSPTTTTEYIITGSTKDNCATTDTVTITVRPKIEVTTTPDTEIIPEIPFQLNAFSPQLTDQPGTLYEWLPPTGLNNPFIPDPLATLLGTKTYTIKITDSYGCSGTGRVTLTIPPPPDIFIPNAFSPDGDGKNEVLALITHRITKLFYFKIYNRWGQLVFSTEELGNGWDGRLNGGDPIQSTYVFKVSGLTDKGKTISKEGAILLIR